VENGEKDDTDGRFRVFVVFSEAEAAADAESDEVREAEAEAQAREDTTPFLVVDRLLLPPPP
jgi:hypothetical protein